MSNTSQIPASQGNQQVTAKSSNRLQLILLLGAAVLIVGFAWLFSQRSESTPDEKNYFTGPMYNFRNGKWVDINGHIVPPPAGKKEGAPLSKDTRRVLPE